MVWLVNGNADTRQASTIANTLFEQRRLNIRQAEW